jgi:hypothetical protein
VNLCVFVLVCLPEKADDKQQEGSAAKTRLSRQLKVFLAKETRACCETTAEKKREKKTAVTPHRRPPLFAAAAAAVFSLSFRELLIVLSTHTLLDLFRLIFFSFFFFASLHSTSIDGNKKCCHALHCQTYSTLPLKLQLHREGERYRASRRQERKEERRAGKERRRVFFSVLIMMFLFFFFPTRAGEPPLPLRRTQQRCERLQRSTQD